MSSDSNGNPKGGDVKQAPSQSDGSAAPSGDRPITVTLPLPVAESLLKSALRLGKQYLKADDRAALEIAEREIHAVREMRDGR